MKKIKNLILLLLVVVGLVSKANAQIGGADPAVTNIVNNPSPYPGVGSLGTITFQVANYGAGTAIDGTTAARKMGFTASLGKLTPVNLSQADMVGDIRNHFDITYDATTNTFICMQKTNVSMDPLQVVDGTINIIVTVAAPVTNISIGANFNVQPAAAYSNLPGNDNAADFTYTDNSTNPISLSSFIANSKDCMSTLNWNSATEIDFNKFIIQSSTNGASFIDLATINGKGSNSAYAYLDRHPSNGKVSYRLKMIDKDGSFKYSSVVALNISCANSYIYPNPAKGVLNLNIEDISADKKQMNAVMLNEAGQQVFKKEVVVGNNKLNVTNISAGAYILKLISGNDVKNFKVNIL